MRVAALILGLIGSIILLFMGTLGYAAGSAVGHGGTMLASAGIPIIAMVGACLSLAKPVAAGSLMGIATVTFIAWIGFNVVTMLPSVLVGVAAIMAFAGAGEIKKGGS